MVAVAAAVFVDVGDAVVRCPTTSRPPVTQKRLRLWLWSSPTLNDKVNPPQPRRLHPQKTRPTQRETTDYCKRTDQTGRTATTRLPDRVLCCVVLSVRRPSVHVVIDVVLTNERTNELRCVL